MKGMMWCAIVSSTLVLTLSCRPELQEARFSSFPQSKLDAVNFLIGDLSFVAKYGTLPDKEVDEKLRISVHLEFVENLLREKASGHLSPLQRKARWQNIDRLQEYRRNGIFPRNYDYPSRRKPCFIDKYGRICAVGHLIEKTVNRKFAEEHNARFQYQTIFEMQSVELEGWISQSGLSRDELAMIQPTYGFEEENGKDKISKEVEAVGLALTGSSVLINSIYIGQQKKHLLAGSLGLLLGTTSLATGLSDKSNYSVPDIALGTAAIVTGILNLSLGRKENKSSNHREPMPQKAQIGLGMIPVENRFGVGLSMR